MTLKERLMEDLKDAMRRKETLRKDVLQILRSAVLLVEKDSRADLDEAGVEEVLMREWKKRSETLKELAGSGREDAMGRIREEMDMISTYLPQQMSEEEIETLVRNTCRDIQASSPRDMGRLMQALMPAVKGKADGKLVNQVVRRVLAG